MSLLQFKNIHFVPSIHQRMEFAEQARMAAERVKPDCIAAELPPSISDWVVRGVLRLPEISAVCFPSAASDGEMQVVPIDPGDSIIEAIRWGLEHETDIEWIDGREAGRRVTTAHLPDDLTVERAGLEPYVKAVEPYLQAMVAPSSPARARVDSDRERYMAERLIELAKRHRTVLCVLGMAHFAGVHRYVIDHWEDAEPPEPLEPSRPISGTFLSHVAPGSLPDLLREIPYVTYLREAARENSGDAERFDKLGALRNIFKKAETTYKNEWREQINLTQFKALYQYVRNLAMTSGRLQPDTYELVTAAANTVDGDYGYEVYQIARSYPAQKEDSSLPTFETRDGRGSFSDREERYRVSNVWGDIETEKIKIRFRRRPTEMMKAEWKKEWTDQDIRGICSWPPEDERQERFMMFMRKRALSVLGEDRRQVTEFTTSFCDGLDVRETMRNWHTKKLFVRHDPQPQGDVGAVVVIFDEPARDELYSWRCTLYAENQNESDISFYATNLGDRVVGPRISRTEFGGILSIYPSRGIPDIFGFPDVYNLESNAETLVLAGILFTHEKYIAYVSPKPASSRLRNIAAKFKKHIIYLPSGGFSKKQIKRVRNFHILGGRDVRSFAADYIFDD